MYTTWQDVVNKVIQSFDIEAIIQEQCITVKCVFKIFHLLPQNDRY